MIMKYPPHPGGVVLRECIEPLGLTITEAAQALGVTRNTLSELVNEKRGISPEMAVRLAKVFGGLVPDRTAPVAPASPARCRRKPCPVSRPFPGICRASHSPAPKACCASLQESGGICDTQARRLNIFVHHDP